MTAEIAVLGVGRIGAVSAIGMAHLGHSVHGIDRNADRVRALANGQLAEAEPGLRAALESCIRYRNIRFTTELAPRSADFAFLCVDTPPQPDGSANLEQIFAAAENAASILRRGGILATRSTLPAGTGDILERTLRLLGRSDVAVVHVPEFLREGHAWSDFREGSRIVVGADDPEVGARVAALFAGLQQPIYRTDRRTSELAKYAANAFLATSISFANEMDNLCGRLSVDTASVMAILKADPRIGEKAFLTPGLGFGGHCLPKDTAALEHLAASHGLQMPLLSATRSVNQSRTGVALAWLRNELGGLAGETVALAGLAFKAGTDDARESPSERLAIALRREGVQVRGWDPLGRTALPAVEACDSLEDAVRGASALVICQPWQGWTSADPVVLSRLMRVPVLYDAPAVLDAARWRRAGFVLNREFSRTAEEVL